MAAVTVLLRQTETALKFSLSPERAERGEEVTATLSVAKAEGARVLVGGEEVDFEVTNGTTLIFEAPEDIDSGSQEVLIILDTEASASRTLGILGNDVIQDQVMIVLEPPPGQTSIDEEALREFLAQREFDLIEFSNLEGDIGPCSGELALIDVNGAPLGQALEELEALEELPSL